MPPKRKSAGRDSGGIGGKMKKIAQNHEIEKLMDISTKLRIHSIEMTQAAKAGYTFYSIYSNFIWMSIYIYEYMHMSIYLG